MASAGSGGRNSSISAASSADWPLPPGWGGIPFANAALKVLYFAGSLNSALIRPLISSVFNVLGAKCPGSVPDGLGPFRRVPPRRREARPCVAGPGW